MAAKDAFQGTTTVSTTLLHYTQQTCIAIESKQIKTTVCHQLRYKLQYSIATLVLTVLSSSKMKIIPKIHLTELLLLHYSATAIIIPIYTIITIIIYVICCCTSCIGIVRTTISISPT